MADYQFSMDPKSRLASNVIPQYNENVFGDPTNRLMIGYISSITDGDILESRYSVKIPELELTIRAGVMYPLGSVSPNGGGIKPFAPEVGTPVFIFCFQESRQGVILGTLNLPGFSYGEAIVQNREAPEVDQYPMWRPAFSNNLIDLGIDSSLRITPQELRRVNNYYDPLVHAGIYVPGSIEAQSPTGINYSFISKAKIEYSPFIVSKAQGILKDYQEMAFESVQLQSEGVKQEAEHLVRRTNEFQDGEIIPSQILERVATLLRTFPNNDGINQFFDTVLRAIDIATKIAQVGDQFVQWVSQDINFILEDLLDTFGRIDLDLDLGLVNIDLDISLTSIDLNLDFRIGTGSTTVDNVVNAVLSTAINTVLDNLLKNVKLGELLGLDLSGLLGGNSVDTSQTYVHNVFTPVLRLNNTPRSGPGNITQLLNGITGLIRLDDSNYAAPPLYFKANSVYNSDLDKLGKYLVLITSEPTLFNLPSLLEQLYLFQAEQDIIGSLLFACHLPEDRLRTLFLYSYYCQSSTKVKDLANVFYSPNRVSKLITRYNVLSPEGYNNLPNLLGATPIYDPLDLDLNLFKDTLISPNTATALDYLISGNYAEFINIVSIIYSKIDLRFKLDKYTKLKKLVNKAFPGITIGYE